MEMMVGGSAIALFFTLAGSVICSDGIGGKAANKKWLPSMVVTLLSDATLNPGALPILHPQPLRLVTFLDDDLAGTGVFASFISSIHKHLF